MGQSWRQWMPDGQYHSAEDQQQQQHAVLSYPPLHRLAGKAAGSTNVRHKLRHRWPHRQPQACFHRTKACAVRDVGEQQSLLCASSIV